MRKLLKIGCGKFAVAEAALSFAGSLVLAISLGFATTCTYSSRCPALASPPPTFDGNPKTRVEKFSDAELKNLIQKAEALYKAHRGVELVNLANEVLARDPKNALFLTYRGEGYGDRRRRENAIADFTASLAITPSLRAYRDRAYLYKVTGEKEKALQDWQTIVKMSPIASNYFDLAFQYFEVLKLDESIAAGQKALSLLNTEPAGKRSRLATNANKVIGMAFLAKNQPAKALQSFTRAVELIPGYTAAAKSNDRSTLRKLVMNNSGLFLLRGEAFEKSGKLKEAIAEYELTVETFPTSFDFRRSLLRAYRKNNQNDKALAVVTDMLRQDDSPDLYYKRSEIYKKLGKPDLAKVDFERARKIEYGLMGGIPPK